MTSISLIGQPLEEENGKKLFTPTLINVTFGFDLPAGDLSKRFGSNSTVGINVEQMFGIFSAGVESFVIFGRSVNEDPLSIIRTPEGALIGENREFVEVGLGQFGWYVGGYTAVTIPIIEKNPHSGIRFALGAGLLQHKIKIDEASPVPQLTPEYKKGYDRLTNGLALKQFLGYRHFSKNKLVNFIVGFEFKEGFTKSRRDFDFSTMQVDTKNRFDMYYGLKIGWTLPIYHNDGDQKSYF